MSNQEEWEILLEDALANATPGGVLDILRRVKSWTYGYCVSCGTYNNMYGGKQGCSCEYKGEWFNE